MAATAGSIASRGLGVATGLQKSFNWGAVGLAAIGGGLGPNSFAGGNGAFSESLGEFGSAVARGVVGSAVSQGIGVATGLQSHFDWTGVAAAGIGAGAFQQVGIGLRGSGLSASATRGVAGLAGDIANAAARSLIGGTDFGDNIIAALPDTIGQTVGNMFAGGFEQDSNVGRRAPLNMFAGPGASAPTQSESITVSAQRLPKWQEDLWQAYYGIGNLVNDASRYVGNQYSKSQVVQARAERERAAVIARPVAQFAQGHPRLLGAVQAVGVPLKR